MTFVLERLPVNDDELWWAVKAMWNVVIPRHTCGNPDHTAPFTAFADAYFRRAGSITLWHGSRGLSGKSFMLNILGLTEAFLKGSDVNLLGGSLAQSQNLHEHMRNALNAPNAPRFMIETESASLIKLNNRARIRPLTASQKTVRGPHPPFLILDEIDEMDIDILDAALGQPMPQKNYLGQIIEPFTVMCSTWQNAEGTFSAIRKRFEERGQEIVQWCVAQDTEVTTDRGQVPIQNVTTQDFVLTREGWKEVQHVTFMGYRPTVSVLLSNGRSLTLTADHKVATAEGFVPAGSLIVGTVLFADTRDADPVPSVSSDAHVGGVGHVMAPTAGSSSLLMQPSPSLVLGHGHRLQMVEPDAERVPTQVVDGESGAERAMLLLPDPTVGEGGGGLPVPPVDLVPVAVDGAALPEHTLTQVVAVINHGLVLPVWDLGVEECHEFSANHTVVSNCYQCSANPIDGWLSQETIDAKKLEIPAEMWRTEYELGEPSIGNRAFDTEAVEKMFAAAPAPLEEETGKDYERYRFAAYERDGQYVAAADWGKEQDYTVISVWRVDRTPVELAYYLRVNRRPYPQMIGWFNELIEEYRADPIHDRTGLGNVVADYVDVRSYGFMMTGEKRAAMLTEYVNAVEKGALVAPRVRTAYLAHKYCQVGDLYKTGQEYHLPDEVCSFALAWKLAGKSTGAVGPVSVPRDNAPTKLEQVFEPHRVVEVVRISEEPGALSLLV